MIVRVLYGEEERIYHAIQVSGFGPDVNRVEVVFADHSIISLPWENVRQIVAWEGESASDGEEELVSEKERPDPAQPSLFEDADSEAAENAHRQGHLYYTDLIAGGRRGDGDDGFVQDDGIATSYEDEGLDRSGESVL